MPIFSDLSITSCTINKLTGVLVINGIAFGENQYSVSAVEYRKTGAAAWTAATSISSWVDSQVTALIVAPVPGGTYEVRLTNSDNEQTTKSSAFKIPAGGVFFFYSEGLKV